MSATNLILVRDSSPLRLVFLHNARRGGLPASDLTNLRFYVQAASFVKQAWRRGSVCVWRLLSLNRAFDSASPIFLCGTRPFDSTTLTIGKRGSAVLLSLWTAGIFPLDQYTGSVYQVRSLGSGYSCSMARAYRGFGCLSPSNLEPSMSY